MTKTEALEIILGAAVALRNLFRRIKDYEDADKIRDALLFFNINIEDKKCND